MYVLRFHKMDISRFACIKFLISKFVLTVLLLCCGDCLLVAQNFVFPLHTAGPYIVDSNGYRVRLNAFNWSGAETTDYVVGGLEADTLQNIVQRAKSLGFNAVRLPWSNQLYESNPVVPDYALTANASMKGQHALTILDAVVSALTNAGINVILDNHSSQAEWCCAGLWYEANYPEINWINDWKGMVQRYQSNSRVIGVDLRNEVQNGAAWGGNDAALDWHAAAQRAGNAVQSINPNLLIFVEGINLALDLSGVGSLPIQLNVANHVVYEAHDYSFDYSGLTTYSDYVNRITPKWGYLVTGSNPQPLWIGEFGTCNTADNCVSSSNSQDLGLWFSFLTTYLQAHSVDWAYWELNGTLPSGVQGTPYGSPETYGVLNTSWTGSALASLTSRLQVLMNTGSTLSNGLYRVVNENSGRTMEVYGSGLTSGVAVDQYTYFGHSNQQWNVTYLHDGLYQLIAAHSGLGLDVPGQSVSDGVAMDQATYQYGANQQFTVSQADDGNYRIVNSNSGLCVEVYGWSTNDGGVIDQWSFDNGANQKWIFQAP